MSDKKSILITGGTGFIGQKLVKVFTGMGHKVYLLSRKSTQNIDSQVATLSWSDIHKQEITSILTQSETLIHLAGENVGSGRWTNSKKRKIISSRVDTLQILFDFFKKHNNQLKTLVSASAVGYYGMQTNREVYTETSQAGSDFLASVCEQWESAASQFETLSVRTVILRTGVVFDKQNSALQKIALPFQYGLGAVLGSGQQLVPWVHIQDMVNMYVFAVSQKTLSGVFNAKAPSHDTLLDLSKAIAKQYNKKIWLPAVPAFFLKWVLGEMAVILLEGSAIDASKIQEQGFVFEYNKTSPMLADLLS